MCMLDGTGGLEGQFRPNLGPAGLLSKLSVPFSKRRQRGRVVVETVGFWLVSETQCGVVEKREFKVDSSFGAPW